MTQFFWPQQLETALAAVERIVVRGVCSGGSEDHLDTLGLRCLLDTQSGDVQWVVWCGYGVREEVQIGNVN